MRDDEARILDIIETCDQLTEHVGADRERFESDPVVQAAAQRWLEIIGEAAARMSDEFTRDHPEVAWRDLVGMRNVLAHGYFHVDLEVMWAAITRDVPQLRDSLGPATATETDKLYAGWLGKPRSRYAVAVRLASAGCGYRHRGGH